MKGNTIKLFLFLIVCIFAQTGTAQTLKFSRPTILSGALKSAPFYHQKIYEDDEYLFVHRHYGSGEYIPGFFIYTKKQKKWIEIKKLSTEHAKLGRYFPFIPTGKSDKGSGVEELVVNPSVPLLAITWDYSSLKNAEYADIPLLTSGSINFPDKITYDKTDKAYHFYFNSSAAVEEMLTEFWVLKADLRKSLSSRSK